MIAEGAFFFFGFFLQLDRDRNESKQSGKRCHRLADRTRREKSSRCNESVLLREHDDDRKRGRSQSIRGTGSAI